VAEDGPSSGGEAFDLRRTLPHILVRLKQDDVDFRNEHACERHRRTDVDANTQRRDLYLQANHTSRKR